MFEHVKVSFSAQIRMSNFRSLAAQKQKDDILHSLDFCMIPARFGKYPKNSNENCGLWRILKSCRSLKMLNNKSLLARVRFDKAEEEPSKFAHLPSSVILVSC